MTHILEIVGTIFTLVCVWLAGKEKWLNWPIGIVACISFFFLFLQTDLYFQAGLQILFIIQSFFGWYNWKKKDALEVSWNHWNKETYIAIITLVIALNIIIISNYHTLGLVPLDVLTSLISVVAVYLLSRKKLNAWFWWIVADILMIILYISTGLYLTSLLYLILTGLAIKGFINWKQSYDKKIQERKS